MFGIANLTGLSGVPSSPWKKSLRRSDELLSMSEEHTSSVATDGSDFSAVDFNDNFDWIAGLTAPLNWNWTPTTNQWTTKLQG